MRIAKTHIIALIALIAAGCSTEEEDVIVPEKHGITFGMAYDGSETSLSRAGGVELEQGFMVSVYKNFGTAEEQLVMDRYEASYNVTPYNGSKWNTVGAANTAPDNFYQTQYERYWDLSGFPYRFNAVSPCPKDAGNNLITGYELTGTTLILPQKQDDNVTYSLTSHDGELFDSEGIPRTTAEALAQEKLIAQVSRDSAGVDLDHLQPAFNKDGDVTSYTTKISQSDNLMRKVALPFHHTNCKVRFGIYSEVDMSAVNEPLTINNVTITARAASPRQRFIDKAFGYRSENPEHDSFLEGAVDWPLTQFNVALVENVVKTSDLRNHYLKQHAYYFDLPATGKDAMPDGTPAGLLQVPQKEVELTVRFSINNEHYNVPLTFTRSDGTVKTSFDWLMSCRYTYYVIIRSLYPFEVQCTATIEPWFTVISSDIDTDLEL